MKKTLKNIYVFFETIPDQLYPFKSEIEGKLVRGRNSYLKAMNEAVEKYGPHRLGYKLMVYRSFFHMLGSAIFLVLATFISQRLFGNEIALYVLMGTAILALFIQEFYAHPKVYGQLRYKGLVDWLAWVVPMMVYLTLF